MVLVACIMKWLPGSNEPGTRPHKNWCIENRVLMNKALLARIKVLEAENCTLKSRKQLNYFHIEQIQYDDDLFLHRIYIALYEFLGLAVN